MSPMYKFKEGHLLNMRKKNDFQYRYYSLAVSYLGSSSCVSANGTAANYVLFIVSRITQDLYAMGL